MWIHQPSTPHIILPSKSLVPGSEVAIEEVTEHFESLQEGLEVGGWLLVLDAKVDSLLQSLRNKDMKTVLPLDMFCPCHLCRALPDDGEDPLEIVFCQVVLQKHLTRWVYIRSSKQKGFHLFCPGSQ